MKTPLWRFKSALSKRVRIANRLTLVTLLGLFPGISHSEAKNEVRILFRQSNPSGSFDAPSSQGTVPRPGSGHRATRLFDASGNLIANGTSDTRWPKWISSIEVGISGAANTSATHAACARFASASEASTSTLNCNFGSGAVPCGAPQGFFRVSEMDCLQSSATLVSGNGGPSDGVYVRIYLDRSQMSASQNLLMTIESIASSYNGGATTPQNCMRNGVLSEESCSDVTWKLFLKHNANEVVNRFMTVFPPTQNSVRNSTSGANPTTRQFVLPLAADSALSVIQLSRIASALDVSNGAVQTACGTATPANSPLCAGLILYSITLYPL